MSKGLEQAFQERCPKANGHLKWPQIPRHQEKTKTTMTATAQLTDQRKPGMTVSDVDKPVTLLEIYSASPKYSYTENFQTVPHTIKHTHLKAL